MSPLGFMKSQVYHGEILLGELDIVPVDESSFQFPNGEIRIHRFSPNSERCPPLTVLHSISSSSARCKLESSSPVEQPHLINLHASCYYELKTAIVLNGDEEIHLVAMPSKLKKFPCFWCYSVPAGLYTSCLGMLNMRCLSIVFDLDETLIVANTMKSFEYRMDTLRSWIAREFDVVRANGMAAELKRCTEDRLLLKQYIESDSVLDNGKVLKAQFEDVPSDNSEPIVRPVIRLPEKGVVLTRINPEIRDTSVLVRLRPAWEDLRSYLIAKEGRKRFEVYVCTMAERDYALEMWRLLDPEGHLIGHKQLPGRVVCVKSGSKKSLLNVFLNGICHPNMAMVIDDRQKVWEDTDQPRVHVVPPFSPYFAPQAETANAVPVLCVARNVACNVRGGFFKEFDENFMRRISEIFFEDEVLNLDLPAVPDVSNYLMPEIYEEGGFQQNGTTNAPIPDGMADAEVEHRLNQPEKRSTLPSQGGWLVDEDNSRRNLNNRVSVFSRPTQVKGDEAAAGQDWRRPHIGATTHSSDAANQQSFTSNSLPASLSIGVLQEIGRRCSSKVEFRPVMSISRDLQFSFEVLFTGEKIGFGMGKTRKDAQQQAADNALRSLAGKYVAHATPSPGAVDKDYDKLSAVKENGFLWDTNTPELDNTRLSNDGLPKDRASEVADAAHNTTPSLS